MIERLGVMCPAVSLSGVKVRFRTSLGQLAVRKGKVLIRSS